MDDILIYKFSEEELLLVVNAGNTQKDDEWIRSQITGDVKVENLSDKYVQLALQGPEAEDIIKVYWMKIQSFRDFSVLKRYPCWG